MSKIPDYIVNGIGRINDFLPIAAQLQPLTSTTKGKIPFGMSLAYDFYETEILGTKFLLAGIEEDEDNIPPAFLEKQRDILLKHTGLTPIFVFKKLVSYLFSRYSRRNINIVVADKQLFLPAIFLVAGKERATTSTVKPHSPVAFQLLVLYNLQKKRLDGMTMREVADILNLSYATVNRCVRWMKERGFVKLDGGKEKRIVFVLHRKELWDTALPFLCTPIDFIAYTSEFKITDRCLVSEQNALAEYTMLNGGSYRIAISKDDYKDFKKNIHWSQFGEVGVEVWKYDPKLLSDTGVVDRLSLYLLLRGYEDERVQIELENMISEIVW